MRYLMFSLRGETAPHLGVMHGETIVDVPSLSSWTSAPPLPTSLLALVQQGPATWRLVAEFLHTRLPEGLTSSGSQEARSARIHRPEEIRWYPPIPRPSKNVFCVGKNYMAHIGELARGAEAKAPEAPMFFTKAPTTVIGPYDDIPWDRSVTQQVDWEAELGVIVGVAGRNIPRDAALEHVFGYTVINDVTARDLQKRHTQFFKGKSLDGFCPMGPVVVTADEFGDPQARHISLRVNGTVKQHGYTRDMIYPVDRLIESLSHGLTLEAGDILATGTPDGVGFGRTPPEFLQDGDIMETELEGIGMMRNRIAAHS